MSEMELPDLAKKELPATAELVELAAFFGRPIRTLQDFTEALAAFFLANADAGRHEMNDEMIFQFRQALARKAEQPREDPRG